MNLVILDALARRATELRAAHATAVGLSGSMRRGEHVCIHGAGCVHGCNRVAVACALTLASVSRRELAGVLGAIEATGPKPVGPTHPRPTHPPSRPTTTSPPRPSSPPGR